MIWVLVAFGVIGMLSLICSAVLAAILGRSVMAGRRERREHAAEHARKQEAVEAAVAELMQEVEDWT